MTWGAGAGRCVVIMHAICCIKYSGSSSVKQSEEVVGL